MPDDERDLVEVVRQRTNGDKLDLAGLNLSRFPSGSDIYLVNKNVNKYSLSTDHSSIASQKQRSGNLARINVR